MIGPLNEELKKAYLFQDFSEDEFNEIMRLSQHEILNVGDQLFVKGAQTDAFFIVHYGSVRLYATGPEEEMEYSLYVGSGGIIGEAVMASQEPRAMNAEILERTEILKIPSRKLTQFFEHHPKAEIKFYRALSRHLAHNMQSMLSEFLRVRESHHAEKHGISSI